MTKYAFTLTLFDGEVTTVQAALELMIKHCQEKMDEGAGAPYWAYKHSAEEVLKKIYENRMQISGNNFFRKKE